MGIYHKTLVAVAIVIVIVVAALLRKRYHNFRHRRKLARMRNKADRLIGGNATMSEKKNTRLIDKFFKMYETSVYIQKEDQIRIQELGEIRKRQRGEVTEKNSEQILQC